jgi:hypothetical protein
MRQIFTSQRLETVEGVVSLLESHGIETRTEQRRSYKGQRRGHFSYSAADHAPQPSVWVVHSGDQARAREVLRQAGLIDSTRGERPLSMPTSPAATSRQALARRIRSRAAGRVRASGRAEFAAHARPGVAAGLSQPGRCLVMPSPHRAEPP